MADEVSTVHLSITTVSMGRDCVQLRFSGALDAELASDPSHYDVLVNGRKVTVQSASYADLGHTVILALPDGQLGVGDKVSVYWNNLLDTQGKSLTGQTGPALAH